MAQASVGGANGSVGRAAMRIPSSFCGTVGHKPTHGLVPYTGAFPIENTIDHLGPITRNVHDAALLLTVLAGRDGLDPRQRAEHLPSDFLTGLEAGAAGLRVAVVAEGSASPACRSPASTRPSAPPSARWRPRARRSARSACPGIATGCTSGTSSPPTARPTR
jgi:amidase